LADWYVYQHDGDPLGPWSTDAIAEAILTGTLAPDVWVAAPGGPRWLRALDVPVIGRMVEGVPTRPRGRESGLRFIPTTQLSPVKSLPEVGPGDTAPMPPITVPGKDFFGTWKADYDLARADGSPKEDPSTDPIPPSGTTPAPPTRRDLAEAPGSESQRRQTKKGA
jgi:hypothetical protein